MRLGRIGITSTVPDDAGTAAVLGALAAAIAASPDDAETGASAGDPATGASAGASAAGVSAGDAAATPLDDAASRHRLRPGSGRRGSAPGGESVGAPNGAASGGGGSSSEQVWSDPADGSRDGGSLDPTSAVVPTTGGAQRLSDGPERPDQPDDTDGRAGSPGLFGRFRRRSRQDPVVADLSSALDVGAPDPARGSGSGGPRPHSGSDAGFPLGPTAGSPGIERGRPGAVVAVWGPTGAPGRSTVAMGIADEAAAAGHVVILIDADVYGGVLAAAFGLLDESPGLAGACRMASNGRLDGATLTGLCWAVGPRFSLLTGIARADRWPEVRPSAIPMVLAVARGLADLVVVDCAAILETDEEISFDTMAPRRNGATLAVLAEADIVLAVGAGDPPGIERLVRGLSQLAEAVPEASPRVVVNRTRRGAASAREISDALARFTGLGVSANLPEDREATDKAWRRCVGLSDAAPRSPLRIGLVALTRSIVPGLAGVGSTVVGGVDRSGTTPDGRGERAVPVGDLRRGDGRPGRHSGPAR